ncbi:MAG: hypothetical protein AAGG75_05835 [Bacteroidota bacterium]
MTKKIKKLIPFIAFLALMASLSSCNRGMGCPTFSVGDVVTEVVDQLPAIIKD